MTNNGELLLTFPEDSEDRKSTWDNYVPIVSKGDIVTMYLMDGIDEPALYAEMCYTLENTDAKKVVLKINNGGGHIDSYLSMLESIKRSKATVVADISGTVASAATMITLACDEIVVADYISFMIHSASGGTGGKIHESKAYMEFSDKLLNEMFFETYKGFLSKKEITKVIEGKDLWMGKKEVLKRFSNMKGARS